MRKLIASLCLPGAGLQSGLRQSTSARPAFEVISIRPSDLQARSGIGMSTYPGGRIVTSKSTLQTLIEKAFNAQPFEIEGLSGWMNHDAWDIDARPPASSKSASLKPANRKAPPDDEQRQMLQSLLADRFALRFHREMKQQPVYFLERGNKPLKLEDAKIKGLSRYLERRVLDRTHISGFFDFTSNYASGDPHPDVVSTIITSLGEIGLKPESGKAPVETIVIDHADLPSPN
jgi:hypothetical protein